MKITKTQLREMIQEELLNEVVPFKYSVSLEYIRTAADDAITDIFDSIGMLDTAVLDSRGLYKNAEVARTMKTIKGKHKDLEKALNTMLKVLDKI